MFKSLRTVVAVALMIGCSSAFAASTLKGVNQNQEQEVVPHEVIASYKWENGKLYFVTKYNGSVRYIEDANQSQKQELVVHFGSNAVTNTSTGWSYHLGRVSVMCIYGGGQSKVYYHGANGTEYFSDGCQFFQVANGM